MNYNDICNRLNYHENRLNRPGQKAAAHADHCVLDRDPGRLLVCIRQRAAIFQVYSLSHIYDYITSRRIQKVTIVGSLGIIALQLVTIRF